MGTAPQDTIGKRKPNGRSSPKHFTRNYTFWTPDRRRHEIDSTNFITRDMGGYGDMGGFKYFSGTLPSSFKGLFTLASQIHSLNTRSSSDIYIPPTPTARSEFSPRIACAREWNALPQELKSYRSLGSFKKNVKKYLKD
jgi:hypothetical protein